MVYDGIILGIIVGLLRGGFRIGLSGLTRMRLKAGWIFPILLVLQGIVYVGQRNFQWLYDISGYMFMSVYAAAIVFLWINRAYPGFMILTVGVFLNFVVMLFNGGKMPVSREMVHISDPTLVTMLEQGTSGTKHVLMTEATRFPLLADVIPITAPYPLPQVISIGDIVMNVGIFLFLYHLLGSADQPKQEASSATATT